MIEGRSFRFSPKMIQLVKALREAKEYVFADQSKEDFIAKMAIASKRREKQDIGCVY